MPAEPKWDVSAAVERRSLLRNSILAGSPGGPLVEQTGVEAGPAFRERLAWSGDRNFYEGFAVFWGVRRNDPEAPYEAMLFDGWKSYWGSQRENLPATNVIRWKQPPAEKPFHAHSADDYALARPVGDVSLNPAVGAASDNGDAGFQLDRLPQSASAPQTPAEPLGPKSPTAIVTTLLPSAGTRALSHVSFLTEESSRVPARLRSPKGQSASERPWSLLGQRGASHQQISTARPARRSASTRSTTARSNTSRLWLEAASFTCLREIAKGKNVPGTSTVPGGARSRAKLSFSLCAT